MKLSRQKTEEVQDVEVLDPEPVAVETSKGRPTPKRRDAQGKRGPVRAPQTRKEAVARQRQLAKEQKAAGTTKQRSAADQRAALRRGDPDALPARDRGPTKKLARDYVDSKRMLSNYLLWLFPLMVVPIVVPALAGAQIVVLAALLVLITEWYIVGRRIRAMALSRFDKAEGGNLSIGFYAGSRAYLPRRWRLPKPQVERGEQF